MSREIIETAMQDLRRARNSMSKADFVAAVLDLCKDGNLRYPLLEAGNVATLSHKRSVLRVGSERNDKI